MSEWTYNNEVVNELPDNVEGFVYLITNLTNDRKYIGKKLARFKTTKPPLKGKKNTNEIKNTRSKFGFTFFIKVLALK